MIIQKILFDLDGTLFDTQKIHSEVEAKILRENGVEITATEITQRYSGYKTQSFFSELLGNQDLAKELANEKWKIVNNYVNEAVPLTDLCSLFLSLIDKKVKFAIGTTSLKSWAVGLLENHNLIKFFSDNDIIGGDLVTYGKPNPEIWFRAAGAIKSENCLVVEDGLVGAQGALSAKIPCAFICEKLPQGDEYKDLIKISNVKDILSLLK